MTTEYKENYGRPQSADNCYNFKRFHSRSFKEINCNQSANHDNNNDINNKQNSNNETKRTTFRDQLEDNGNNQPQPSQKLTVDSDWQDVKKSIVK
jgi:hypothetical protein